jgi:hypothetical protein
MYTPSDIEQFPRTGQFIRKCEDLLFWNLKDFVPEAGARFVESVHKQMVKYPERFPTEKQAVVIDRIYDAALDEMAREGRYALYMLPLKHREDDHSEDQELVSPIIDAGPTLGCG